MTYYHTPARMAKIKISDFGASEDVEKLDHSYFWLKCKMVQKLDHSYFW